MKEPEIIYKYKDFKKCYSKKILFENELFLSSPKTFNDPFDCRIPPDLNLLNTEERRSQYVNRLLSYHEGSLKNNYDKASDHFNKLMVDSPETFQKIVSQISIDTQNKILGILCLTNKWNDILMWSHYGQNHQGICYGFDFKALKESIYFNYSDYVKYTNEYPLIDPLNAIYEEAYQYQTQYKAKSWAYEEEYRFVKIYDEDVDEFSEKRRFKISDSFFKEIIIGVEFPENEIQKVIDIAEKKKIALFRAKRVDWKYELERERIV
jgi:hypothetical protein